jgi:YesN/AraC family two-component response regulator
VNAIQVAQEHTGTIDLLLTDVVMPKLGGRELAGELRKMLPRLKTIFISGYAGHDAAEKDLELPSTYFLQKPFSIQHLAKMVREVLDGVYQ